MVARCTRSRFQCPSGHFVFFYTSSLIIALASAFAIRSIARVSMPFRAFCLFLQDTTAEEHVESPIRAADRLCEAYQVCDEDAETP